MAIIGIILVIIGAIIALIYGIILLVMAFQESILWGLGYLFVPFVSLIFVIMHWDKTKKPFLMSLISIPFILIGSLLMPAAGLEPPQP